MVRAVLEGRKTQTRRVVKPQPNEHGVDFMPHAPALDWEQHYGQVWEPWHWETEEGESISKPWSPYGQSGDRLYVREMWQWEGDTKWSDAQPIGSFWYKADEGRVWEQGPSRWKPSIHMPKSAARIFLEVTEVRVERLQDISEEDAIAEGILFNDSPIGRFYKSYTADARGYGHPDHDYPGVSSAVKSYETLWQSINGPDSWDNNPWVWVITFKRIEPCPTEKQR